MKNLLHELWFGNVRPFANPPADTKNTQKLALRLSQKRELLLAQLTEQQTKLLAEYECASEEITSLAEANAFSEGFRLGVELMIEVMKGYKTNI